MNSSCFELLLLDMYMIVDLIAMGTPHYSDRVYSDRRYSDRLFRSLQLVEVRPYAEEQKIVPTKLS